MTNSYKELLKQREALEQLLHQLVSKSYLRVFEKPVNWWLNLD